MESVLPRFTGAVILSLMLAFVLTIIPVREQWLLLRPDWLALAFIHWGLMSPNKSSLLLAWFVGLAIDAVFGSIMGQHALGYTIVLFMTLRMRPRLLIDSFIQQLFLVFIVLVTYFLINLWILGITGNSPIGWGYWYKVATSMLVWPVFHYFMHVFHARKKSF